jgi:hypothetical protein
MQCDGGACARCRDDSQGAADRRRSTTDVRPAVRTEILHFPARVVVTSARTLPIVLEKLSGVRKRPMIVSMPTTARPQAALRPPPSAFRPTHRGRDRRHGPGSPSLDSAWLAGRGADDRGRSGCCGPHRAGAPTGGPEAAATGPQADGAAPARAGPATNLRVSSHRRATTERTRQDPDPARRGPGPATTSRCERSCGSYIFAQSVPCLALAAGRVCPR